MPAREHVIVAPKKENFLRIKDAYRDARRSVRSLLLETEERHTQQGITTIPKGLLAATYGAGEVMLNGLEGLEFTPEVIRNTEQHLTAVRRGCEQLRQNISAGIPKSLPDWIVKATVRDAKDFLDVVAQCTREALGIPNIATNPQTGGPKRVVDVDSVEANRAWRQANRSPSAVTTDELRADMRRKLAASPKSATSQATKPPAPKSATEGESVLGLDSEELEILKLLNDKAPRLLTTYDLEAASTMTRKTAGKRLTRLLKLELATRPKGPNDGTTITAKGAEALRASA